MKRSGDPSPVTISAESITRNIASRVATYGSWLKKREKCRGNLRPTSVAWFVGFVDVSDHLATARFDDDISVLDHFFDGIRELFGLKDIVLLL